LICSALKKRGDSAGLAEVAGRVAELAGEFSPYPHDFAGHV
jgi:hypothetical protein